MKMQFLLLVALFFLSSSQGLAQTIPAADAAGGLPTLKRQFEGAIKETLQRGRENIQVSQQKYLAAIEALENDLQDAGQLQGLIALREEKRRFAQDNDIPKGAIVGDPEGLRQLQTSSRNRIQADRREQALQVVTISAKYMRDLSALQKALAAKGDSATVVEVRAEKDALLDNNVVREALVMMRSIKGGGDAEVSSASDAPPANTASSEMPKYKFYTPGKEPVVSSQTIRSLHMISPNAEQTANSVNYQIAIHVYQRPIEGDKKNFAVIPRLTLTAKGRDVPADSKLVVDYFSHGAGATSGYKKETSETIPQNKLPRGMAIVMDAAGIPMPVTPPRQGKKSEKAEKEFYGVVVSLFSHEGKLLYQQCSLPALVKECGAEPFAGKP
jgi:Skp family chaperone for outer membrane proteins